MNEEIPSASWEEKAPNSPKISEIAPLEPLNSWECTCIKNTQIRICVGNLTQEPTDAVLIMNKDNLKLNKGGQLNVQIAKAAGPSLKTECKRIIHENGAQLPGEAVMTESGNLPCKHIIHVIAYPGIPQILDLQLGVKKGLQLADAKGLVSIALPAIGAGGMRLPLEDSARVLSGGILSFLERRPQSLREIKIVLYMESMLWTYSQEMKREFVPIVTLEAYSPLSTLWLDDSCYLPVLHLGMQNTLSRKRNGKNSAPAATQFRVFGKDRKSIMDTINGMQTVFTKHCTVQKVTHKMVPQVTQHCWGILRDVASKHDVELTIGAHKNAIAVRGNSDDVSAVVDRIWQEITHLAEQQNDVERHKLLAQYVRWHYVILDKEIGINDKLSATIEDACNRKCSEVSLFVKDCEYKVDFNSMTVLSSQSSHPPLRLRRRLVAESGK